jgi:hypothetical protein
MPKRTAHKGVTGIDGADADLHALVNRYKDVFDEAASPKQQGGQPHELPHIVQQGPGNQRGI